ncbi:MAG: ABC transporter ATP-binding protein [Deltaproteobacteria bacterium]|nr:ABC transporter ATP-binding protein [Deltaproteobacteria bacterium]
MLELSNINTFYDKSHILHDVSLEIKEDAVIGLLGRNGVGKSTTLKSIIGIVPPQTGSIRFQGREIRGLRPYRIARLGIGYVPEDRRIFPTLTVRENLLMGMKSGGKPDQGRGWSIERVYECFPRLGERDSFKGGYLSGGEQQMLTIGRTLMGDPKLILLDEPTEGLAPQVVETVAEVIREIHRSGVSVLLVEQAMEVVLELAQGVLIMNKGEIVFRGTPEGLKSRPDIREQYIEVS